MAHAKRAEPGPHARVFPALPPSPGSRGAFASSWWGEEWIAALEETSMDSGRLSRGRTYARRGAVAEITVTPGKISAKVHGSRPRPYTSSVHVRVLDDEEWDRLLDTVAAKAAHIAALLDRDMPHTLVEDAAKARVLLLPADDELDPDCSCPDWGYPCKHAAALCYQIARILDEDPFVLLLMRGRDEDTIMTELHRRNNARAAAEHAAQSADPTAADESPQRRSPAGTPARTAFAAWQPPQDPMPVAAVDDRVAQAAAPIVLGPSALAAGFDPPSLETLAAGAAAHAKTLLDAYLDCFDDTPADGGRLPALLPDLDAHRDAVRLLSGEHRDIHVFARLVDALGIEPARLARGIVAWRYAGAAGLEVLEEPWTPPADELARSRTLLHVGWSDETPPRPTTWRNRWTFAEHDAQLRYGRDGRWHPYRRRDGAWWPDGPPGHDPADVLAALL